MDPLNAFAAFEGRNYAATTRRVYLSAAKKALKIVGQISESSESYEEFLTFLRENKSKNKFPRALRIAPFVNFWDSKIPKDPEPFPDYGPVRAWVLERI